MYIVRGRRKQGGYCNINLPVFVVSIVCNKNEVKGNIHKIIHYCSPKEGCLLLLKCVAIIFESCSKSSSIIITINLNPMYVYMLIVDIHNILIYTITLFPTKSMTNKRNVWRAIRRFSRVLLFAIYIKFSSDYAPM